MTLPEHEKAPEFLIGAPAKEVVKEILRVNPNIDQFILRLHPFRGALAMNYPKEEAIQKVEISRDDILLNSGIERWINYLGVINENEIDWELLGREHNIRDDWPLARYLSVDSRVELPELAHIPMLDFDCQTTFRNLQKIISTLYFLGQKGYVLDSSNGFHFWGRNSISEYEWRKFLEKTKENPLIDREFIEASLGLGFSCLRITKDVEEGRFVPRFVATL